MENGTTDSTVVSRQSCANFLISDLSLTLAALRIDTLKDININLVLFEFKKRWVDFIILSRVKVWSNLKRRPRGSNFEGKKPGKVSPSGFVHPQGGDVIS